MKIASRVLPSGTVVQALHHCGWSVIGNWFDRVARAIVGARVGRVIVDIAIEDTSISTVAVITTNIREISIRGVVVDIPIVAPKQAHL